MYFLLELEGLIYRFNILVLLECLKKNEAYYEGRISQSLDSKQMALGPFLDIEGALDSVSIGCSENENQSICYQVNSVIMQAARRLSV